MSENLVPASRQSRPDREAFVMKRRQLLALGAASLATIGAGVVGTAAPAAALLGLGGPAPVRLPGVSYRTVTTRGGTLSVGEAGPIGGPPVVLVHGGFVHGGWFVRQVKPLVDDGYRVVIPDMPGSGASPPRSLLALGDPYDLDALALADLIDTLALDRPLIVGWSLGGLRVSRGLGPGEVLESRAGAVLFTGTWAGPFPTRVDIRRLPQVGIALTTGDTRPFAEVCLDPGTIEPQLEPILLGGPPPDRVAGTASVLGSLGDSRDRLRASNVPIRVSHGTEDKVAFFSAGQALADLVGTQLQIFEGSGHALFITDAPRFHTVLTQAAAARL